MPVKMLAAVFHRNGGPEVVSVEEVDRPEPAPGEARIRVEAASLNHLDLWVRRGLPIEIPMPHIGGSDFAGTVDAVGSDGDRGWIGRRVVVDPSVGYDWYELATVAGADPLRIIGEHTQGGFAEFAVAPVANLVELPDGFPASMAAAGALVGVTAWHGLFAQGGLRAGERVLVTGAKWGCRDGRRAVSEAGGRRGLCADFAQGGVERARGRPRLRPPGTRVAPRAVSGDRSAWRGHLPGLGG